MKRDPHGIVDFADKDEIPKGEKFYWREEDEEDEIINIVAMSGI